MADVVGAVSALRAAFDIARAAKDVHDQAKLNTAINEILEQLTSANFGLLEMQQQHQQILDENRELRQKIDKEARFEQYRLEKTSTGDFILILKPEHESQENPMHTICPKCKEDGRLSIMGESEYFYDCKSCKAVYSRKHQPPVRRNRHY